MRSLSITLIAFFLATNLMAAQDDGAADKTTSDKDKPTTEILHAQVLLDRLLFSPGAIDGLAGRNFEAALEEFQTSQDLKTTSSVDEKTSEALVEAVSSARGQDSLKGSGPFQSYKITAEDGDTTFSEAADENDMAKMARQDGLYYTSVRDMLAERFHTTPDTLKWINPQAEWKEGETVQVPNVVATQIQVPADLEKASEKSKIADYETSTPEMFVEGPISIIVSKEDTVLAALDKDGKLVFHAPVTAGSKHDPLPLGKWKVNGTERYPVYHYNPDLFWDAKASDDKAKVPPGPKNPVGVAWIDISKPHYGIHGTPDASKIGYTESHGCVRLTNWDVLRLARMVKPGATVYFVETAKERKSKAEEIRNAKADKQDKKSDDDDDKS